MAIQTINNSGSSNRRLATRALTTDRSTPTLDEWVRPSEWPALPAITDADEKFVGVTAIFPNTDMCLVSAWPFLNGNDGTYVVDWGDGTVDTIASGEKAVHSYDYNNANLTSTSYGYKCAVVTITPSAGKHIVSLNLSTLPDGFYGNPSSNWLDIALSLPSCTTLTVGYVNGWQHTKLERARLLNVGLVTSFYTLLYNCARLASVTIGSTALVTDMTSAFQNCRSLKRAPVMNTAACTNFTNIFSGCSALREVPFYNTANVTLLNGAFTGCRCLERVPLFNTSKVTQMSNTFQNCASLTQIPAFDTSRVVIMNYMLASSGIRELPPLDMHLVTNCGFMLYGCCNLEKVGYLNTSNCTYFTSLFNGCTSLKYIGGLDTSKAVNFAQVFGECHSLKKVPPMNTSAVTDAANLFSNCWSLEEIPALDLSKATQGSWMFNTCTSLKSLPTLNLSKIANLDFLFQNCYSLTSVASVTFPAAPTSAMYTFTYSGVTEIPAIDLSNTSQTYGFASQTYSLNSTAAFGATHSIEYTGSRLSLAKAREMLLNLGKAYDTYQTVNLGNSFAYSTKASAMTTASFTAGNPVLTTISTSGIVPGQLCTCNGISTGINVTLQGAGDTVTLAGHGLSNGTKVYFSYLNLQYGLESYKPYWVVNSQTDTFQVAATQGGSAIDITGDMNGILYYPAYVVSVVANTSITLSAPPHTSNTDVLVNFSKLDAFQGYCKGWQVLC